MTGTPATAIRRGPSLREPVLWGLVFGAMQAASPIGFWWLDQATVHALMITLIAAVYVGFAVADGRPRVIAFESVIVAVFFVVAAAGVTGTPWLLVVGYAGHGLKDFWQERRQFVANTRWWPPFCATVDWLVAVILVVEIAAGVDFH
jgi:hypothetical protein